MTFLHPGYFLALLGLAPLIAVYFLKVRPRRRTVTALFLWQAIQVRERSTALFQRLRDLGSLVMMILALVAVVLAMTSPQWSGDPRKDLLLIIDNSASMQALEGRTTRLDAAKALAVEIIRGLDGSQRAAVAAVSIDVQYATHFTTSPKTLVEAVRGIEPSDCALNPEALSSLAAGAIALDRCRMILISDGGGARGEPNDRIERIQVGSGSAGNIGLVACDLRQIQGRPVRSELYVQLASCFDKEIRTDLLVTVGPDDRLIKVIPVVVRPGINPPEVYSLAGGGPGPWKVSLDFPDSLARDNTAFIALQPMRPVRVKVESQQQGFFLASSVLAFSQTSGDLEYCQDQADVVLAAGQVPRAERSIVFGLAEGASWCGQAAKEVDQVIAHVRVPDHPILKDCDLEGLAFVGAREVQLPQDSLVLVETPEHVPLIYRVADGPRTAIVVNMDLMACDFPLSAWFPVLVYHGATFLMGRREAMDSVYRTGESIPVPTAAAGIRVTATGPQGGGPVTVNGPAYGPIRKAGFHNLEGPGDRWLIGASLLAPSETLLNNPGASQGHPSINRGWPLWVFLVSLALVLMISECMLYHRRKVG
jgi:hypothetical protein